MAETEQKIEVTTEDAFRWCINEKFGSYPFKKNVVRVELRGIARFACWWFVIWSIVGGFIVLANLLH